MNAGVGRRLSHHASPTVSHNSDHAETDSTRPDQPGVVIISFSGGYHYTPSGGQGPQAFALQMRPPKILPLHPNIVDAEPYPSAVLCRKAAI